MSRPAARALAPVASSSAPVAVACTPAQVARVLDAALTKARGEGLTAPMLEGCGELTPTCDGPPLGDEPGGCQARVHLYSSHWEVDVKPASFDGAPVRFEVRLDRTTLDLGQTSRVETSWATAFAGGLQLRGETSHTHHEHGGAPATVSEIRFVAYNREARDRTLTLRAARWIASPGQTTPLARTTLQVEAQPPAARVTLPAQSTTALRLTFAPQRAYQSWNNHFVVEADFLVDAVPLTTRAEIQVTRFNALRRQP